jgi:predicted tellurium resistance membrane protein TerC
VDWLASPDAWVALLTLTALEIVLGIDNIIFISILSGRLPVEQQALARRVGLGLALGTRLLLLLSLSWIIGLTQPLFTVLGQSVSGRDLILIVGGLFLVGKATYEIHHRLEGDEGHGSAAATASFAGVIVQILLLDIVFSLDSVITAVGMVDELAVMVAAVVIAVGVMLVSADPVSNFVNRHPTVKMLALAFLVLIGTSLLAEGFHHHIPKGYIYSAMAFSVFVEMLNLAAKRRKEGAAPAVHLRPAYGTQYLPPGADTVPNPHAGATVAPAQRHGSEAAPGLRDGVAHSEPGARIGGRQG